MAEFLEYARALRCEINAFLNNTALQLKPALELVACGYDPQHYVPFTSLESHARVCHRAKHYDTVSSHEFFYVRHSDIETKRSSGVAVVDKSGNNYDNGAESDSLVEPTTDQPHSTTEIGTDLDVVASIQALAADSTELVATVKTWRRIPRAFARLGLHGDVCVSKLKLKRWIKAELARTQQLPANQVDSEMVEFVLGLLEHPEFCHPDLVVLELEEFLGMNDVKTFVSAMWRFMAIDVGLQVLPNAPSPELTASAQHAPTSSSSTSKVAVERQKPDSSSSRPHTTINPKRRRPSYRAKSTRAGPYDLRREILAKFMAQLSEETGRELVETPLSAPSASVDSRGAAESKRRCWGREVGANWSECTDALRVRDTARPIGQVPVTGNDNQRPRSRSRTCHAFPHAHRRDRSRSHSRSRGRDGDRRRDHDRGHTKRDRDEDRRQDRQDRRRDRSRDRRRTRQRS